MSDYLYIDPRGRRSGPFSEAELKLLASRGLLETDGHVELEGLGSVWSVGEVPWLSQRPAASVTQPTTPPPPPPDAPAAPTASGAHQPTLESLDHRCAAAFSIPPQTPQDAFARASSATPSPLGAPLPTSSCSRAVFVILAILPACIGLFGLHSIVAGYTRRGIIALVLSIVTCFGCCCIAIPPCACLSVPVWIVLFVLAIYDACTVKVDAKGRALS